ncbi:hypothetical protein [Acinetobacter sp. NPDC052428]|uniref:hypothetical protein n=1 Tax=Acinetobacter sp. NPDC052428 TaxID=3363890 RepID=UPI0037C9D72B
MSTTWNAAKEVYHFNQIRQTYSEQDHLHALATDIMTHESLAYVDAMQKATAIYHYHLYLQSNYLPNRNARYQLQQQSDDGLNFQPAG